MGANPLRLVLPPEIQAAPSHAINIYFDNIVLAPSLAPYVFDVACAKGTQQDERWTFIPKTDDVGTYPLKITVRDGANQIIAGAATVLNVIPADAGADKAVSCLLIGDSLTAASVYPAELVELCKTPGNPKLMLIGTNRKSPETRHEGYGGWTAERFARLYAAREPGTNSARSSPFVYEAGGKTRLDFKRYLAEHNGGQAPDIITILLGCNDNFRADDKTIEASIDSMFASLDMLIGEFHAVRADTKIGLILPVPPAASQDAFGANYHCEQTRWQYRRNQHRVVERMLKTYGGREEEKIYLVPANVNLDTVHNYPRASMAVNSRNPEIITRQANGVHPAREGYYQIADSIYYWLKSVLRQ